VDGHYESNSVPSAAIIDALKSRHWHQGYKKYQAQVLLFERRRIFFKNLAAMLLFPLALGAIVMISYLCRPGKRTQVDDVYVAADHPLMNTMSRFHAFRYHVQAFKRVTPYRLMGTFDKKVAGYFGRLVVSHRYLCRHPYLMLHVLIKVCAYQAIIATHAPRRLYSFNERSYAGPFITEFLNSQGIAHHLVMHGLRIFSVKDAFCAYDSMYVFGEYFAELFAKMQAKTDRYCIMGHPTIHAVKGTQQIRDGNDPRVLVVLQPPEILKKEEVIGFMHLLQSCSKRHRLVVKPRHDGHNWLAGEIRDLAEEKGRDNMEVLSDYGIFCGKNSTYLLEAWSWGKKVILLGTNSLPRDVITGPNVLRLPLQPERGAWESERLEDFLSSPPHCDWNAIRKVFSDRLYAVDSHANQEI